MKKRLYLVMADENLFHPRYVLDLIRNLKSNYQVVGITKTLDSHKSCFFNFLKQQLDLWGFLGFLYIAFWSSIYSFLDKFNLKDNLSLRNIAKNYNLIYFETYDVNNKEHLEHLKKLKLKIDIIISSCGHIFKKELLSLPRIACINRHSALLPKYGGVLPVFWAMYFREKEFGVSIHYMVEKVDQGDILSQIEIPLKKENSLFKNYILAFNKSITATIKALENIKNNKIAGHFYPNKKQYFSFPSLKKINELRVRGYQTFSLKDIFDFLKRNKYTSNRSCERKVKELYSGSGWVSFFTKIRFWTSSFVELEKFVPKKGTILDLGCGYGIFGNYLALTSPKRTILGLDTDKEKIKNADKGIKNTSFKVGNATKMQLENLDCILLLDVLHHLNSYSEQEKLIEQCRIMLKEGGVLIISDVDRKPLWKLIFAWLTDFILYKGQPVYYRYKKEMLKALKTYFPKIKVETLSNNPYPHLVYICQKI